MNVDPFLARRFTTENCWTLVREVWLELTGIDLGDRTPERMTKDALIGRFEADVPGFRLLDGPSDPSIVLMRARGRVPHVGIFLRGRILQLVGQHCTFLPPDMATAGWPKDGVGYYR